MESIWGVVILVVFGMFAAVMYSRGVFTFRQSEGEAGAAERESGERRFYAWMLQKSGGGQFSWADRTGTLFEANLVSAGAGAVPAGATRPAAQPVPPRPTVRRGPGGAVLVDAPRGGLTEDATILVSVGGGAWSNRGIVAPGDRAVEIFAAGALPAAGTEVEIGLSYTGAARDVGPTTRIRV